MSVSQVLYSTLRQSGIARSLLQYARRKVVTGFDEFCTSKPIGRALVSYLVLPVVPPRQFRDRVLFSNHGIAQAIPQALNELGYEVDIVNHDHATWVPRRAYDIFVGHGGRNFERLATHVGEKTLKVYFSTGIWWREANRRAAERLYDATVRTGYLLPPERAVECDEDPAVLAADGLVFLGNSSAGSTYGWVRNKVGINNAVFPIDYDPVQGRDYSKGRRHFLFFSGKGNVHKGLDVLLEAFDGLDADLHICQYIQPQFGRVYRQQLNERPNIHLHGFLPMRSREFRALALTCNWTISATCAEGQPGAVLECMAHGLIPVLSAYANIDLDGIGVPLPDCSPATIRKVLRELVEWSPARCSEITRNLLNATTHRYTAANFVKRFAEAIQALQAAKQSAAARDETQLSV
jgi:glycosyltransferase involved in cell wall biosynthesis